MPRTWFSQFYIQDFSSSGRLYQTTSSCTSFFNAGKPESRPRHWIFWRAAMLQASAARARCHCAGVNGVQLCQSSRSFYLPGSDKAGWNWFRLVGISKHPGMNFLLATSTKGLLKFLHCAGGLPSNGHSITFGFIKLPVKKQLLSTLQHAQ